MDVMEFGPRVVKVSTVKRGLGHEMRAVKVVMHRDLLKYRTDTYRMVSLLVQPVLYLFVLGAGLSAVVSGGAASSSQDQVDFKIIVFPGAMVLSVMFTAMFSAGGIVWDREVGFFREMLVAPVSRTSIVCGKILGGAVVAVLQGGVVLACAGLAGLPYDPVMLGSLLAELSIGAFAVSAFGTMLAAHVKGTQTFFGIVQLVMMPMLFLSGAWYPLAGLPGWLAALARLSPLTYVVDPLRQTVFDQVTMTAAQESRLDPGVTWFGRRLPVALELALVGTAGLVMLAMAVRRFRRTD
ncbi:ABC transporter permease [Spirillospora sp. CA-142024]|uniref:ABC transporter permease n=1 Tax=Spirillospora sp. CA-142024 TaxID=3240036 RepID=UPI003D92EF29